MVRRHLADRLHTDRVLPLGAHDETFPARRMGRLRILRLAFAVLLGAAPAPRVHTVRTADHLRRGQPQARRTRRRHRHVRPRPEPARRPRRPDPHRRQGLRVGRDRTHPHRPRPGAGPLRPQRRTAPPRRRPAPLLASDHRIGQRHSQGPAQLEQHGGHSPRRHRQNPSTTIPNPRRRRHGRSARRSKVRALR